MSNQLTDLLIGIGSLVLAIGMIGYIFYAIARWILADNSKHNPHRPDPQPPPSER